MTLYRLEKGEMKHSLTRPHGTRSKQCCATVRAVNRKQQNIPTLDVFLAVPSFENNPRWRKGGFHRKLKETRNNFQLIECFHMTSRRPYWCPTAVSHNNETAAMLVSHNKETAAMLVSHTNPLGVELFSYANSFYCSKKFA